MFGFSLTSKVYVFSVNLYINGTILCVFSNITFLSLFFFYIFIFKPMKTNFFIGLYSLFPYFFQKMVLRQRLGWRDLNSEEFFPARFLVFSHETINYHK